MININDEASKFNIYLTNRTAQLNEQVTSHKKEIQLLNNLYCLNDNTELEKALAPAQDQLDKKQTHYDHVCSEAGFFWLKAPLRSYLAWKERNKAKTEYNAQKMHLDSSEEKSERSKRINAHNAFVESEKMKLDGLQTELERCSTELATVDKFHQNAKEAIMAAQGDGWYTSDFDSMFMAMIEKTKANNFTGATKSLSNLRFQRKPSKAQYTSWINEASKIREKAFASLSGVAALGAYHQVAEHSMKLSSSSLNIHPPENLHVADRWQCHSLCTQDPEYFKTDLLWTIYWSMFQCGQSIANNLTEADAHEDVFTGKLTAQIDRWLCDWAKKRIAEFGYPDSSSYIGTLEIAGSAEETRTGADIGLIIDMSVGDLICHKVALFQAKKTVDGLTNIGSKSGQLEKLSKAPSIGYYLFYNQSTPPLHSPGPTVCSAISFLKQINQEGKTIDSGHIKINVREMGWDWASFITFGLCDMDSVHGEPFNTIEDAFEILGGGDPKHLPKYLHVISIGDDARVLELREKIHEHYMGRSQKIKEIQLEEKDLGIEYGM